MSLPPSCPVCGNSLAGGTPHGLCPACLLKAGVPTGTAGPQGWRGHFHPPSPAELARDFPQLEIIELIGQGGMGAVYRARQPSLDRVVALKILPPRTGADPGFAERFSREARALARLSHPNIVTVHDFGQAGAFPYLVMEFVDGVNLRHLLAAGKIAPAAALAIVPPICDALQYAHDRGIVHRDIKPENILLGKNGAVKIADFGLAKIVGTNAGANLSLTGARDVMGTPYYMAPEQVQRPLEVDHRADIYSLGVVFYQMLTGELPLGRFAAPSRKVTIDVRLDEVVLRALEQAPEQRYQQASAFKTEVETIGTNHPAPAPVGHKSASTQATARSSPSQGIDYRTQLAWRGWPLLHIATGKDPATGKRRTARGILAIGTFARGWAAVGLFAFGGIAIGPFAVGGFAFGGLAVGFVAFGWSAVGLVLATGSTALGGLAYGRNAWSLHAISTTVSDAGVRDFAGKLIQPLARSAVVAAVISVSALQLASLVLAIRSLRDQRLTRRWPICATLIGLCAVLFLADFGLLGTWPRLRWAGRDATGFVDTLSPQIRQNPAVRDHVVIQAWLADIPASMELTAQNFPAARAGALETAKVREIVRPVSVPSGGSFEANSIPLTEGRTFRLRATAALTRQGYRYNVSAVLSAIAADETGVYPHQSGTGAGKEKAISVFEYPGTDQPAFIDLGTMTDGRKRIVVVLFQSWKPARSSGSNTPPPIAAAPPAPAAFAPTEFDALESDPQILQERLRLAEANLQLIRAKFDAGLNRHNEVLAAEQKVSRLKAKLAGDRLAFAQGDVQVAKTFYEEIRSRRSSGVATDEDFLTAESELRIAEIRLKQEEDRARQSPSTKSVVSPSR